MRLNINIPNSEIERMVGKKKAKAKAAAAAPKAKAVAPARPAKKVATKPKGAARGK